MAGKGYMMQQVSNGANVMKYFKKAEIHLQFLPEGSGKKNSQYGSLRYGFTLVELSIVLIIIGLIVGGVVAGQSMIKAAQISRFSKELMGASQAYYMFKDKYEYPPGDMPNATQYWTDSWIQDGDGNNYIEGTNGSGVWEVRGSIEHMGKSGFMQRPTGGNLSSLSSAFPCSAGPRCIIYFGRMTSGSDVLGNAVSSYYWDGSQNRAILTPADAYKLDKKMDDGIPNDGKFRAVSAHDSVNGCRSGSSYVLSSNELECYISYLLD
jgi:prepilin-type N-terminal cleavage/methylation domain-containing protein